MAAIKIQILGLGGPLCVVDGDLDWSVRQLKSSIEELCSIAAYDQGLFFGSSELRDGAVLKELLPADDTVDLALLRRQSVIPELLRNPQKLESASRTVVMAVLAHRGSLLAYVGADLRHDTEVISTAIEQDPFALMHTPDNLRSDRKVIELAVRRNGCCLQYAAMALRNDAELVLEAVQTTGAAIEFAGQELRESDRFQEVVLAAVKSNGEVLQDLPAWANDREVVLTVARHWPHALRYASKTLRGDAEVMLAAENAV